MNYQTNLGKVRGLGSAKTGTMHWWMQRVTAFILIPLTFWLTLFLSHLTDSGYREMVEWLAIPFNSGVLIFFIFCVFYHAAIGLQVVIEDYVHTETLKIFSIWFVNLSFIFLALISMLAVLRILFLG